MSSCLLSQKTFKNSFKNKIDIFKMMRISMFIFLASLVKNNEASPNSLSFKACDGK